MPHQSAHPDLRALSLGAGVQSSTMYRMAVEGAFGVVPDVAIFADTQAEPPWVYEQLEELRRFGGSVIPIRVVTAGSLEKNIYWGGEGRSGFAQIPAFLRGGDGNRGIGPRQCTHQYKIKPIERACREILGLKRGERAAGKYMVEQWIGISTDEAHRAKTSDVKWITRRYPLLFDVPMRRGDCMEYHRQRGLPLPKKSSCFFCPYHRDREWKDLRDNAGDLFERACQIDDDLRGGGMAVSEGLSKDQYLHDSLIPLRLVDLDTNRDQPDLFGNECEGVCGV